MPRGFVKTSGGQLCITESLPFEDNRFKSSHHRPVSQIGNPQLTTILLLIMMYTFVSSKNELKDVNLSDRHNNTFISYTRDIKSCKGFYLILVVVITALSIYQVNSPAKCLFHLNLGRRYWIINKLQN